jgi:type VI secretion system protein ImpC
LNELKGLPLLERGFEGPSLHERLLRFAAVMRHFPDTASDAVIATIESALAAIDALLSLQLREVFRHPAFQALESTWRGLHWLVNHLPSGRDWRVHVLGINKQELAAALDQVASTTDDRGMSRIERLICSAMEWEEWVGVALDFAFSHRGSDVDLLEHLAKLGAAIGLPVLAGVSPELLDLQSWEQFDGRTDLQERFQRADRARWCSLCQGPSASQLILSLPGFLVRPSYAQRQNITNVFEFIEDTGPASGDRGLRASPAYLVASRVARAYQQGRAQSTTGWAAEAGGSAGDAEALLGTVAPRFSAVARDLRRMGLVSLAAPVPIADVGSDTCEDG